MAKIDTSFPRFALYFRRYAHFDVFGALPFYGGNTVFYGDNRGPSTSIKANITSRTYCFVIFNRYGIIHSFADSSGTTAHSHIWGILDGHSKVNHTVVRNTLNGPDFFGFKASTAGSNPLVPKSPDINTFVDVKVDFGTPNRLNITGQVFGDNFPDLEVFLLSSGSHEHTALLLDGRTSGGAHTGPPTRIMGSHEHFLLGSFSSVLALNQKGELANNSMVPPTKLGEYPAPTPKTKLRDHAEW